MSSIKRHGRNRNVVNAENRLYSPEYDWEGDPGLALSSFEVIDADAMCYWWGCGHDSYNAWVKATNAYIEERLVPHYNKVLGRAQGVYSGAPLPQHLQDRFNKIEEFIRSWEEADYRPTKTLADDFLHPLQPYWWGEIRSIIAYFDDAALYFDELNAIAAGELKSPALADGPPRRTFTPSPTGSYFDGSGGPNQGGGNSGSGLGKAVGIMALGGAMYFGFKVLTE